MKNIMFKILSTIFVASALITANVSAANPASFSLSLSSSSVTIGDTFSVSIFENGDNVNVVTSKLVYDSTKLQLLSAVCGTSFPNSQVEVNGVTCYLPGGAAPVSNNVLAASISFKALVGSGSSIISLGNGSMIASSGNNIWDNVASSKTISLITPTPTPTPTTPDPTPTPIPTATTVQPGVSTSNTPTTIPASETTNLADTSVQNTTRTNSIDKTGSILGLTDTEVDSKSVVKNGPSENNSNNTKSFNVVLLIAELIAFVGIVVTIIVYFYGSRLSKLRIFHKSIKKLPKKGKSKIKNLVQEKAFSKK